LGVSRPAQTVALWSKSDACPVCGTAEQGGRRHVGALCGARHDAHSAETRTEMRAWEVELAIRKEEAALLGHDP
jgi:hypothetical protein